MASAAAPAHQQQQQVEAVGSPGSLGASGVAMDEGVGGNRDPTALSATLTLETDTTVVSGLRERDDFDEDIKDVKDNKDSKNVPSILVVDEYGQPKPMGAAGSTSMQTPTTLAPRVTEAILQTQTRRRAQLQQQAAQAQAQTHASSSSLSLSGTGGAGAAGTGTGELPVPVQRQVKGRFKSSPLAPVAPRVLVQEKDNVKEKVADSDPNLKDPKDGQ